MKFTNDQEQIINHYKGPALVIAGPGAGKTLVITERVRKLILDNKIDPEKILVTTFTEKAANELKVKLSKKIGKKAEMIHISTVHSFCKTMLEKYFLTHDYGAEINVLDDESQNLLLELNKVKLGISYWEDNRLVNLKRRYNYIADIKSLYETITQNQINIEDLIKELKSNGNLTEEDEKVIRSYNNYLDLLNQEKLIDFSLLEIKFYDMINKNKDILKDIKNTFNFILVDEFQDTSPIQDKIFRKISGEEKNILVVGDENQSIYGFRGANIENFRNFVNSYDGAKSYFLGVNFRSTETIVDFSNKIFEEKVKKLLDSKRRKGDKIKLLYGEDSDSTAKDAVALIKKLKEDKIISKYGEISMLFRSLKGHSPEYIKYLTKEKIPFVTFGDGKFLDRIEIQTILYLMSYVTQELYLENRFKKWDNWWRKDIFLNSFFNFSDESKEVIIKGDFNLYDLKDITDFKKVGFTNDKDILKLKKLNRLKYDVQREKESFGDLEKGNNSLLKVFYKILDYSNYFNTLMKDKDNLENKEILQNLGKLSEIINKYMNISKKESVKDFLWYIYNSSENFNQYKIEDENTIKLMTVHQSKGLEFPVVFMCCLNEGRFPLTYKNRNMIPIPAHFLNKVESEEKEEFYEEERRLFYVGLTRAQDNLIFTASKKHRVQNSKKSRFLELVENDLSNDDLKIPTEEKYEIKKKIPNLNYSSINTFIDCPLRYTLIYDYGFVTPASFMQSLGTFVHNTLQKIHENMKNNMNISPTEMREIVKSYWIDLPLSQDRNTRIRENLVKDFVAYYIKAKDEYSEIIAIEESFSHIDDNMIIKGKIDLIVKDKEGKVKLVDFKTRKSEGIEKTNVDKQLQIYDYCLDKKYNIDKLIAHTFQDNKTVEFPISKGETQKFLNEISTKIYEEDFHKKKNSFCKECQFNFHCWGEEK